MFFNEQEREDFARIFRLEIMKIRKKTNCIKKKRDSLKSKKKNGYNLWRKKLLCIECCYAKV